MSQDLEQLLEQYKHALQHYAAIPGEVGARARVALDGPLAVMDSPYLIRYNAELNYNPNFGDNRKCKCGHPYFRHFDPYEDNRAVGCKYCHCYTFVCESIDTTWKLFLDDERDPVDDSWIVCRTVLTAIGECTARGLPTYINFDHDLGNSGNDHPMFKDGIGFAHWMIEEVLNDRWTLPKNFDWYVHSQNPIGAENINALMHNWMRSLGR